MLPVNNILRSVYRASNKDPKLNILTLCRNNEKYISLLAQTGHDFYLPYEHRWNQSIEAAPANVYPLRWDSDLDFIICYDRAEQYMEAYNLSRQLHVPIILIDMCSEDLIRPHSILEGLKARDKNALIRKPILRVCNSKYIHNSWNNDSVSITIPLGIDCDRFYLKEKSNEIAVALDNNTSAEVGGVVSNNLANAYKILLTDQPDHGNPTVIDTHYFINSNTTITIKLLEAMAAGNVVICLKSNEMESFIQHNHNGVLINSIDDLSNTIKTLENTPNKSVEIGNNARSHILENHSLENFIKKWKTAFSMVKSSFYTPDI